MSETRTVRLGDVCQVTMGQAPKGDTYNTDGEGYPLIAGAGDFDKKGGISVSKFTTAPTRLSEPGDIIMSIRASIGATVWADKIYCLGRGVAGLRPGPELDSQFLWYWLPTVEKLLLSKARGATFVQVNRKDVEELPMELPPLDEQRKFAEEQHLKFLIQQKRERQQELFEELSVSYYEHHFSQRENFIWVKLGDITSKIGSGATPKGGSQAYKAEGIALIRSMNVHDRKFVYDGLAFIDDDQAAALSNVEVQENDILLNITGASVARVCRVPADVLPARVNQHVAIIRLKPGTIKPELLERYLTLPSVKRQLLKVATSGGATREAITKSQIISFQLPIKTK